MKRPYIICHMVQSVDGKVTGDYLGRAQAERATDVYYEINREYKADAFACGRVTMEGSFTGGAAPDLSVFCGAVIPREDHIADRQADFFAVAFDRCGRLGWTAPRIEDEDPGYGNSHIIEVLCEDAPDAYLAYLCSIGVSYIFAGEKEMDLPLALEKLHRLFGIQKLLLEGGSILNGAFQREGLVDELSLVVAPVVAAAGDKPLFDNSIISDYILSEIKNYGGGVIWMNYKRILQEERIMRKNFGAKPMLYPMPVLIIGSYDEQGTPNAMNAAWGGISEENEISICVSADHKTTKNILARSAFTVSVADAENVIPADYVGIVSGNTEPNKIEKAGWQAVKSEFVDAPLFEELPMALECKLIGYDEKSCRLVGEIVNVCADERILGKDGKIDLENFRPITYDPVHHTYRVLGEAVGKAFNDGNKLK